MVSSKATTVEQYLRELPEDRRRVVSAVRDVVRKNLPKGYEEAMGWGMIGYHIPLSRYPKTYNGQPLAYAAIAAQKSHYAIYLMGVYGNTKRAAEFKDAFDRAGKKLDMGKSCVRFKSLDDIPLAAIGDAIAAMPVDEYIAYVEKGQATSHTARPKAAKKSAARKKQPAKRPAAKKRSTIKK